MRDIDARNQNGTFILTLFQRITLMWLIGAERISRGYPVTLKTQRHHYLKKWKHRTEKFTGWPEHLLASVKSSIVFLLLYGTEV